MEALAHIPPVEPARAAALLHLEMAEQRARRRCPVDHGRPGELSNCAIINGGMAAGGLVLSLLEAGFAVTIVEPDIHALERARSCLGKVLGANAAEVTWRTDFDGLVDADLVIEAGHGGTAQRLGIFTELDRAAPEALLATCSDAANIDEIAGAISRPGQLVGLGFSPLQGGKVIELVRGRATSHAAIATACGLIERLGRLPVFVASRSGLIGTRITERCLAAAEAILLAGGLPWEVDEVMVAFGYAIGPYEAQDLSGLDDAFYRRRRAGSAGFLISDRMVEEGRLGKKVGVGWYRYPGGGGAVVDPLLEDLIAEEARYARVSRREFSQEEIVRRLVAAMVDEAACLLGQGVVASPADIDLVAVHGNGFPHWRGGLMHHAAETGFGTIVADIGKFVQEDPNFWKGSPALLALAEGQERGELLW